MSQKNCQYTNNDIFPLYQRLLCQNANKKNADKHIKFLTPPAECESATDGNSTATVPESENADTTENGTTEYNSQTIDSTENELESTSDNDSIESN